MLVQAADLNQEPLLLSMRTPVSVTLKLAYDVKSVGEHRFKLVDGSNYVGYDEYYVSYRGQPRRADHHQRHDGAGDVRGDLRRGCHRARHPRRCACARPRARYAPGGLAA